MTYGDKYYGSFKDFFDRTVLITIKERNYTGSSTEIKLAGASIDYSGSDNDLYNHVISSSLKVKVVSESDFQYIDLYSADAKNFKVVATIDAVELWSGFLLPDLYVEPYTNTPYISEIVATDGLKGLDSEPFEFTGTESQANIIEYCLRKIYPDSTQAYFYEAINTYEENQNYTTSDSPLTQTFIDCDRFNEMNCYEVIESILKLYGARIYHKDGYFWIVSIHEFKEQLNYRYHAATVTGSTYNSEILLGKTQDNKFANVNQELIIQPAWKKFHYELDLKRKESFVKNYDFQNWTLTGYETLAYTIDIEGVPVAVPYESPVYSLDNWPGNTGVERYLDNEKYYVLFTENNSTPQKFITQNIGNGWKEGDRRLFFDIEFDILSSGSSQFWIKVEMWDGTTNFRFLKSDGSWTSSEAFINIEDIEGNTYANRSTRKLNLESELIPIDGYLYVYVYASDKGNLLLYKFNAKVLNSNRELYPEKFDFTKIINENNNYIPSNFTLEIADFPDYGNTDTKTPTSDVLTEQFIYYGGTFLNSSRTAATTSWQTREEIGESTFTNADHLHKIISNQKESLKIPKWTLNGSVLSKTLKIDSAVVDNQINNKKYIITNGTNDLENCIFNINAIEIGSYSASAWILETGAWHDEKIWIDTETWIDP